MSELLSPDVVLELLDKAEAEGWTVADVKREITLLQGEKDLEQREDFRKNRKDTKTIDDPRLIQAAQLERHLRGVR
jgi:hypothetical protein